MRYSCRAQLRPVYTKCESSIRANERDLENALHLSLPPAAVSGLCSCWFLFLSSRATAAAASNAIPASKTEKVWRKTRLLTNDGMLKTLCLDVEELFDSTWSNSLNDVFANCKRRSTCP